MANPKTIFANASKQAKTSAVRATTGENVVGFERRVSAKAVALVPEIPNRLPFRRGGGGTANASSTTTHAANDTFFHSHTRIVQVFASSLTNTISSTHRECLEESACCQAVAFLSEFWRRELRNISAQSIVNNVFSTHLYLTSAETLKLKFREYHYSSQKRSSIRRDIALCGNGGDQFLK